ncbi:MAG: DUF4292 domain-containing protein [Prevotella sp.]|nr:DUF4292 domain-containing protein [Prevotella sp.]
MKASHILKTTVLAICAMTLAACHTHKQVTSEPTPVTPEQQEQATFLEKVNSNVQTTQFVSSKLKFTVEYGPQQISLTGNLKMKRDDVIQLQLMAFGFVEAGRLEFTKDYVLLIDRINKQYLKVPYNYVDFLRNSGINFYTLQALFWNELFLPGKQSVDLTVANDLFTTIKSDDDIIISLEDGKMNYNWLAAQSSGRIKMANISYRDTYKGNTQLNWDYREFSKFGQKLFPTDMGVTLSTPEKEVKVGIKLNYLGNESEWETRTKVSDKYHEVDIDQILRRLMAL